MTKFALLAAFAALTAAQPVLAQASSVLIIGQLPTERTERERTPLSTEQQVELAAERLCEKPFLRDLKGQVMFRECVTETREQVRAVLVNGRQIAGLRIASR